MSDDKQITMEERLALQMEATATARRNLEKATAEWIAERMRLGYVIGAKQRKIERMQRIIRIAHDALGISTKEDDNNE